jgi:uncharacterized protein
MKYVLIYNHSKPEITPIRSKVCDQFMNRFRGLMFTRSIMPDEGLLLVHDHENRIEASIHMFFMFYNLAIVWINSRLEVVDTSLAKKWHPMYIPSLPAHYTLETHPNQLKYFNIGNQLEFQDA